MRREREPGEWVKARSQIFALFNRLGIQGDDKRHRIQQAVTGCTSLRFMTDKEHQLLIKVLDLRHSPVEREQMIQRLLAFDSTCQAPLSAPCPPLEFAHINLEAKVELIDQDGDLLPASRYPATLIVRQGIEVLLNNKAGHPEALVFLEYHQGQVRLLIWDETLDPFEDPPTIHMLKEGKPG